MKCSYSTYSTKSWPLFKRFFPKRTERDFCEFASRLWTRCCMGPPRGVDPMQWDRDSAYVDNVLEFLWRFRKVSHYFLAPGVADFCASSVKEFSNDYCKRLPSCAPVDAPCSRPEWLFAATLANFDRGPSDKIQGGFAVHFPAKEHRRSVMVIPDAFVPVPAHAIANNPAGRGGALHYYFVANDGEDTLLMQPSADFQDNGSDAGTFWIAKLIFGLSLYMDAFPDAVVAAGDNTIHQIKHYDGVRHFVARNEIVEEEHRHSVSPHWRRGHWRLLASARFTRKQGQTVYVRGAFVGGMAFDVLDDTQPKNLSKEQ